MQFRLSRLMTIGALAALATGVAAQAGAQSVPTVAVVQIDNQLNPSKDSVAKSSNPICVVLILADGGSAAQCQVLNSVKSNWQFPIGVPAFLVRQVVVEATGNDMFIIDKMTLFNGDNGQKIQQWGVDNETGYCLSTDPSDGTNSHCTASGALDIRFFDVSPV